LLGSFDATATVSADGNATVLRLSVDAYERLCEEDARLALRVQAELSKRIAERLSYTSAAYQRAMNT
jgi:CRP-like cAMP-binding protein